MALLGCLSGKCDKAWDYFEEEYGGVVCLVAENVARARGMTLAVEDLEEVKQEVALRLLGKSCGLLNRFDPKRARLSTWVGVVARSTTADWCRRSRRVKLQGGDVERIEDERGLPVDEGSDFGRGVMELLTPAERRVLRALGFEGLSPAEAAKKLGISRTTVYVHKANLVRKMRPKDGSR